MSRRLTLRSRITIAYAALGFVLSVLFAMASIYLTEDYETIVVNEILLGQAEDYAERLREQPDLPLPRTHRLSGYLRRPDGSGFVPADVAALVPGIHEIEDASEPGRHAGVFDTEAGRLTFVINLNAIEALERYLVGFMLAVIVLGTAAGGWLGALLAGRTIQPVIQLAAAVDALPARPELTRLAILVGEDELGRLAAAIDAYQARLADADAGQCGDGAFDLLARRLRGRCSGRAAGLGEGAILGLAQIEQVHLAAPRAHQVSRRVDADAFEEL